MKNLTWKYLGPAVLGIVVSASLAAGAAAETRYGEQFCGQPGYSCVEVQKGDTWDSLWPDENHRDLVKRVNRMNVRLRPGMTLAVPENLQSQTTLSLAPFPAKSETSGNKQILVDLDLLAWGAYDLDGNLVAWGPAAGGKDYCPDVGGACRTVTGEFSIERVGGAGCKSRKFPIPRGGAPMPYCMFFHGGYALHGSYEVPGYNASHGCVRILPEDAKWLSQEFIDDDTKVTVQSYGQRAGDL